MTDEDSSRTTAKRQIARLIGGAHVPIYVLSELRTLVFANDALGSLLNRDPDSLLGLECDRLLPEQGADLALRSWLGVPPNVDEHHMLVLPDRIPIEFGGRDDQRWLRTIVPLDGSDAGCHLVILKLDQGESEWAEHFDKDSSNEVHRVLLDHLSTTVAPQKLWFLVGDSPSSRRVKAQLELAAMGKHPVVILGPNGSMHFELAFALTWMRWTREGGRANKLPPIHRIECRLMDRDLLLGMFELIEGTGTNPNEATAVLVDLERLPVELIPLLLQHVSSNRSCRWIATFSAESASPTLGLEDLHPGNADWGTLCSILLTQTISLPSLQSRKNDFTSLVASWIEQHASQQKSPSVSRWTNSFIDALQAYSWPGDCHEFEQAMKHAVESASDPCLTDKDLPASIRTFPSFIQQGRTEAAIDLDQVLEELEKTIVLRALDRYPRNKSAAAKAIGISRARLLRRLQQWGITSTPEPNDRDDEPMFVEVDEDE